MILTSVAGAKMNRLKQISYLVVTAVLAAGIGCGIKGPPLPPIETVEDKINAAPVTDMQGPKTISNSTDTTNAIPPK